MDYKGRFLPQERLMPDGWTRVEAIAHGRLQPTYPVAKSTSSLTVERR